MSAPTRQAAAAQVTAPGQPFELIDAMVNGRRQRVFKNAPATFRALYEDNLSDLPFLAYEDERYTFREAWRAASRIGHVLVHDCGVAPGDRVAISMRNYPEWMLAFCAATSVGAIAVAMNSHWQTEEMQHGLSDSGAKVLIADGERLDRLAQIAPVAGLRVLAVRCDTLPPWAESLQALTDRVGDVPMPAVALQADDLAIMLYTSGSSGKSKGVPSTHRMALAALISWECDASIRSVVSGITPPVPTAQPGTLLAIPLFHVTGLLTSFLSSYRAQRRLYSMYKWDAERAAQMIQQERITSLTAPAAVTGDMVRVAQRHAYDLSSLAVMGGGGAPRPPEQVRAIHETLPNCAPNIGWGMTETNAIGTGISGPDYIAHPSSSGVCSQVLELRVTDESGHVLPAGQRGELWVRGTSVFSGYWNLPAANASSFDGDWFRTGDGAYLDEEGYLYIVDRLKDIIIRGGENIGCGRVEAALVEHPGVIEAVVYAVPDERLGEEVGATVYAKPGLDLDDLRGFLQAHLSKFEIPRYINTTTAPLPRTASGKLFKREIRTAALSELKATPR